MSYQYKLFEMNREDYIKYRSTNSVGDILYHYYLENRDKTKQELSINDFGIVFNMWGIGGNFIPLILAHYDNKFETTTLISKEGKEIKTY